LIFLLVNENYFFSFQASHQNDAAIILWNTNTWKSIVRLAVHQLTVVRMAFSNDGRYLLSVSRDRSWSLFEIDETSIFNLFSIFFC
jgi:elongator complex protein 2